MRCRLFVLLVCGGLLAGAGACARIAYQYQPLPAPTTPTTSPAEAPQLLFLGFRMQAEPRTLTLVSARTVPGQAAGGLGDEQAGPAYLTLTQLDASQQPCAPPVRVAHPLLRDVEYPADADGKLARREVSLAEAEFFVRMVRQPVARAVRVQEVAPAVATPLVLILPLPLAKP